MINKTIENQIEALLEQMTLEEKVSLCHANSKFSIAPIERLAINELTMSDGLHGVRSELERDGWVCLIFFQLRKKRRKNSCGRSEC